MNAATPAAHHAGSTLEPKGHDLAACLQQSTLYREYQHAFQTATGLPLVFRPAGSFQAPFHGAKNANGFCSLMAARSKTCAACLQLQQRAEAEAHNAAATLECFAGLSESLIPVRIGEQTVGYLQTGQVFLRRPTEKLFRQAVQQLREWHSDIDEPQLRTAFFATRVLTRSNYDATVRLLASFAQHLSMIANELMLKEAAAEPPAVARARAFIAEHLDEALSLHQVAQAAHMSAFYFCKVFKAATGLTLTDYLARTRIERIKQLLVNPHMRVSEAAYAAGFQSLSQFNRVFRRIVGQSPSTYRDHLHGAVPAGGSRSPLPFAA